MFTIFEAKIKQVIVFSNSKINLGLYILNKRTDGYHDISTVFYPIMWKDIIEILPDFNHQNQINITTYGISLNIPIQENILFKAYQLLIQRFNYLPSLNVYLYKQVPFGAGLGGGSANAAFFLKSCNTLLNLNLSNDELKSLAANLGADCAFFIENTPCLASGKGDVLTTISLDLSDYYIYIIYPKMVISTKEAYQSIMPIQRAVNLNSILQFPLTEWKYHLENDFEKNIFTKYPILQNIKQQLYEQGALYASMSGSGSAIFGIFKEKPSIKINSDYKTYLGKGKL